MKILFVLLLFVLFSCKEKSKRAFETVSASATMNEALAVAPVNYTVPDEKEIRRIGQPSGLTCWAAVATMMYTWKNKRASTIEAFLDKLSNPAYKILFKANKGLGSKQKPDFLQNAGLKFEYPASFLPSYIESKLKAFGPLWVTTKESEDENFSYVHARICYGISGDGTPAKTFLMLIDPDGPKEVLAEPFDKFIKKYENGSKIEIQMVHW